MTTTAQLFKDADIVYAFTRAQAIQDGYQMKLEGEMAAMTSNLYKYPVYLTSGGPKPSKPACRAKLRN